MAEAAVSTQQSEDEYTPTDSPLTLDQDHILSGKQVEVVARFARPSIGRPKQWLGAVLGELRELLTLPVGWDSYGSSAIDGHAASRVMDLLNVLAREQKPRPALVPTSAGGIQLEWYAGDLELHLEVEPDRDTIMVFYSAPGTTKSWEGPLGDEPDPIDWLLWRIAQST